MAAILSSYQGVKDMWNTGRHLITTVPNKTQIMDIKAIVNFYFQWGDNFSINLSRK